MTSVYAWNRFNTPNLTIVPELVAASHTFVFNNREISVLLPTERETEDDPKRGREPRYTVTSWHTEGHIPISMAVDDVDVRVSQPVSPELESAIADYKSRQLRNDLGTATMKQSGELAHDAFEHWLSIVRWQTRIGSIGRLQRLQRQSWGTYLRDSETHKQVLPSVAEIVIAVEHKITVDEWQRIQHALIAVDHSPLFYDLFFDGVEHYAENDTRRAVIDFTSACEVLLKTLLDRVLPVDLLAQARTHVLKAPASALLAKFGEPLLGAELWPRLGSEKRYLVKLFEERNAVVHGHQRHDPDPSDCHHFARAVAKLLELGSERLDGPDPLRTKP